MRIYFIESVVIVVTTIIVRGDLVGGSECSEDQKWCPKARFLQDPVGGRNMFDPPGINPDGRYLQGPERGRNGFDSPGINPDGRFLSMPLPEKLPDWHFMRGRGSTQRKKRCSKDRYLEVPEGGRNRFNPLPRTWPDGRFGHPPIPHVLPFVPFPGNHFSCQYIGQPPPCTSPDGREPGTHFLGGRRSTQRKKRCSKDRFLEVPEGGRNRFNPFPRTWPDDRFGDPHIPHILPYQPFPGNHFSSPYIGQSPSCTSPDGGEPDMHFLGGRGSTQRKKIYSKDRFLEVPEVVRNRFKPLPCTWPDDRFRNPPVPHILPFQPLPSKLSLRPNIKQPPPCTSPDGREPGTDFLGYDKDPQFPGGDDKDPRFPGGYDKDSRFPGGYDKDSRFPGGDDKDPRFPGGDDKDPRFPGRDDKDPRFPGGYDKEPRFPGARKRYSQKRNGCALPNAEVFSQGQEGGRNKFHPLGINPDGRYFQDPRRDRDKFGPPGINPDGRYFQDPRRDRNKFDPPGISPDDRYLAAPPAQHLPFVRLVDLLGN